MRKLLIALSLLVLAPLQANAYAVDGWDIYSLYTSGNNADLRTSPWYGSSSLAAYYAGQVGGNLGYPNSILGWPYAPYFVYDYEFDSTSCGFFGCWPVDGDVSFRAVAWLSGSIVNVGSLDNDAFRYFALANPVLGSSAVPEPGSLALLGIGLLGLGLFRRKHAG